MNYDEAYATLSNLYDDMVCLEGAESRPLGYTLALMRQRYGVSTLVVTKSSSDNDSFDRYSSGRISIPVRIFGPTGISDIDTDTGEKVRELEVVGTPNRTYTFRNTKKLVAKPDGSYYTYKELQRVQAIVVIINSSGSGFTAVRIVRSFAERSSGGSTVVVGKYITRDNKDLAKIMRDIG